MASKPPSPCSPPRKRARLEANDGYILPADALQEVLLRLPSKCLCRLRGVCQSWRYMLSDPLFVAAHASLSRADPILVLAIHHPDRELVDVHHLDVTTGAVLKRMDGLARRPFCVGSQLLCFAGAGGGPVQVLDPGTSARLDYAPHDDTGSFYLVGHVAATGEQKVLHLTDVGSEQSCEVLSVGAGRDQRWRPTRSHPPMRVDSIARRRAVVDGVAYFLPFRYQDLAHYDMVAAFDLETEQWRPAPIRGPVCSGKQPGYLMQFSLAELEGRLVLIHHNRLGNAMDMYCLTDAGKGEWSRTHSLRLNWVVDRKREAFGQPMAVLDDGRVALFVPGAARGVVRLFDPRTGARTEVVKMYRGCTVVGLYRGSLLPFRTCYVHPQALK
ncbi:unnamed protein product [Alopecurus aequalis]